MLLDSKIARLLAEGTNARQKDRKHRPVLDHERAGKVDTRSPDRFKKRARAWLFFFSFSFFFFARSFACDRECAISLSLSLSLPRRIPPRFPEAAGRY